MELVQGCAISAAGIAAATDVWSRRIPNWLTFGTLALGLALNSWLSGLEGAVAAIVGAALGLLFLAPFFALGVMGAGDVKLLAGLGALLGPRLLVSVAIYAALAGGVVSAVFLLRRGRLLGALGEITVNHRPPMLSGATAPYGVAIALGVLASTVFPAVIR